MKNLRDIKVFGLNFKYLFENTFGLPPLRVLHYQMRNWGDSINPIFANLLTKQRVISVDIDALNRYPSVYRDEMYLGIGSIIHHSNKNTIIWGSGLQEPFQLRERPKAIHAVRGPHTRQVLLDQGLDCPEVFGDPALLLPKLYNPSVSSKKFKLGIISHIKDVSNPVFDKFRNDPDVKFISMRAFGLGLIDSVLECENIISTSLHGLVLADAYRIPRLWIKVSNKIPGNDFKFHDYHASLGAVVEQAAVINISDTKETLRQQCTLYDIGVDLDKLLEACPYKD